MGEAWLPWTEEPHEADTLRLKGKQTALTQALVQPAMTTSWPGMNATPRSALECMPQGAFAAMVSTQNKPWTSIPLPDLMTAIAGRASGAVRSDALAIQGAPPGPAMAEMPAGFEQGAFWYDYCLPV